MESVRAGEVGTGWTRVHASAAGGGRGGHMAAMARAELDGEPYRAVLSRCGRGARRPAAVPRLPHLPARLECKMATKERKEKAA